MRQGDEVVEAQDAPQDPGSPPSPENGSSPPLPALALLHVFQNLCSFQKFWGRKLRPDYEFRYYLLPSKANPVPDDRHHSVTRGGRATGKSWDLELEISHAILHNPYGSMVDFREREVLLTAAREAHVEPRCEPVYEWFTSGKIPLWKALCRLARRKKYEIRTVYGTTFWGITVGDDPTAKNLEGPHPWWRAIEEMSHFTPEAWKKFQDTSHEQGSVDRIIGVTDGRIDMPFYQIDRGDFDKYRDAVIPVPQVLNPHWDQIRRQDRVATLGGENADAFLQQVYAEHGNPVEGVWDVLSLSLCLDEELPYKELIITPRDIIGGSPIENVEVLSRRIRRLIDPLPRPDYARFDRFILSMDPGYTQQGEIVLFGRIKDSLQDASPHGIWHLLCRVLLRDKVIHNHATRVLHEIAQMYPSAFLGIDATGEQGKDIGNTLMDRTDPRYRPYGYTDRIFLYEGQRRIITGHQKDERGVEIEVKEKIKVFATESLQSWFGRQFFRIPSLVKDFLSSFNAETMKILTTGVVIVTPPSVHLPDVFRVFFAAWHAQFGKVDAPEEFQQPWVDPAWVQVDLGGVRL